MEDIRLSTHFMLSEFTASETAERLGIDNTLNPDKPQDAQVIVNLRSLCLSVLEPLRYYLNPPYKTKSRRGVNVIMISSGYRCPALNKAVKGVSNSQHLLGEAADIPVANLRKGVSMMKWIASNTNFDQCILEHNDQGVYWLHISCRADHSLNRRRAFCI